MNTNIVDQIADKLQVPVTIVWGALLKQAPISASCNLFIILVMVLLSVFFI